MKLLRLQMKVAACSWMGVRGEREERNCPEPENFRAASDTVEEEERRVCL